MACRTWSSSFGFDGVAGALTVVVPSNRFLFKGYILALSMLFPPVANAVRDLIEAVRSVFLITEINFSSQGLTITVISWTSWKLQSARTARNELTVKVGVKRFDRFERLERLEE